MYVDIMRGRSTWQRIAIAELPDSTGWEDFYKTWQIYTSDLGELGAIWGNFCMDFDHELNPDKAQMDCILVYEILKEAGVKPENIRLNFSGKKGFHMEIDYRSFMNKPQHNLHLIYRKIYEEIEKRIRPENGKSTMDSGIYIIRRQFRITNTKHSETGLYCIPITRDELDLNIDYIKGLATTPRYIDYTFVPDEAFGRRYEIAVDMFYRTSEEMEKRASKIKLFTGSYPPCITRALALKGLPDGSNRNWLIYNLARFLKDRIKEDELQNTIIAWCNNNNYPEKKAVPTVRSALKREGAFLSCGVFKHEYSTLKLCDNQLCDTMSNKESSDMLSAISERFDIASLPEATRDLKIRIKQGEYNRVLKTGIHLLDNKTLILQDSLIVIGANSNFGKTSFATTIIANNADKKCCWISIEEGKDRACIRAAKAGFLTDNVKVVTSRMGEVVPDDINALLEVYTPDFVIIDQLINMTYKTRQESERLKYKKIMEGLREVARVQKCPIFLLHQLSREAINADEPIKEHLAEGADIERLAYDIWLLHRKWSDSSKKLYSLLTIAKIKFGKPGTKIPLDYCFDKQIYENIDLAKLEDQPTVLAELGLDITDLVKKISTDDLAIKEIMQNDKI